MSSVFTFVYFPSFRLLILLFHSIILQLGGWRTGGRHGSTKQRPRLANMSVQVINWTTVCQLQTTHAAAAPSSFHHRQCLPPVPLLSPTETPRTAGIQQKKQRLWSSIVPWPNYVKFICCFIGFFYCCFFIHIFGTVQLSSVSFNVVDIESTTTSLLLRGSLNASLGFRNYFGPVTQPIQSCTEIN